MNILDKHAMHTLTSQCEREDYCYGCNQYIDKTVCHCGDYVSEHNAMADGHYPVYNGCLCFYDFPAEPEYCYQSDLKCKSAVSSIG